jgi:NNP family nitrate/nitrite transporter-like MFS transporter
MFGLFNVVFRPAGGMIADVIYCTTQRPVEAKKFWLIGVGFIMGLLCFCIGLLNPHDRSTLVGLVACLALFMEGANGAVSVSLMLH